MKRSYELEEQKYGSTNFEMKESFEGLMAPLVTRKLPDLTQMFLDFERDLRRAVK